jgi:hypothetical protein
MEESKNANTSFEMYVIILTLIYKSLAYDATGNKVEPEVFDMFCLSLLASFDIKHKAVLMKAYKHVKEMGLDNMHISVHSKNDKNIQKLIKDEKEVFTQLNNIFKNTDKQ